ncbi:hypothetical protein CCHR01_10426 [Colletotrichum chrysophilum]|uniref:HTH CENPB-type domain-containing protein n=1 Tax=Colletotrichum chrysophilum TaxID=1836956 RepID=A0AAD9AF00_9PEZI|nr:hypothetical protein CCHR01_10426 [Colletotrichum chrysophilum]
MASTSEDSNLSSTSLMSESSFDKKTAIAAVEAHGVRKKDSASAIQQFLVDFLLIIPSMCFIIYGIVALQSNGRPIDEDPVPALRMAATYSPTVFPIAFAAVAANLLKAAAGWKMERGVTVLSLEYLLSCRTVFSAVTTPLSLRRANILVPFLVALWAMSPLGGQAALRIMDAIPSQYTENEINQALADMANGISARNASRRWGVPRSTLQDRTKGAQQRAAAFEDLQRLSHTQEAKLASWVQIQADLGLPPTHQQVKDFAQRILHAMGDTQPLGKRWMDGFLARGIMGWCWEGLPRSQLGKSSLDHEPGYLL